MPATGKSQFWFSPVIPQAANPIKASAGLLTCSGFTPSQPYGQWQRLWNVLRPSSGQELTATGIVADFHCIPFSFRITARRVWFGNLCDGKYTNKIQYGIFWRKKIGAYILRHDRKCPVSATPEETKAPLAWQSNQRGFISVPGAAFEYIKSY